jgi:hypothetical protein
MKGAEEAGDDNIESAPLDNRRRDNDCSTSFPPLSSDGSFAALVDVAVVAETEAVVFFGDFFFFDFVLVLLIAAFVVPFPFSF